MGMKRHVALLLGVLCLASAPAGAELSRKPEGRISDFARILTQEEKGKLQRLTEEVERANGAELAVVTLPSLDGLSVEECAVTLFKQWGVGKKGKDNGVLFLVAPNERKARIEVGYGLEGSLNDAKAGRILDEAMPYFKSGQYGEGLLAGCESIAATLGGDPSRADTAPRPPAEEPIPVWLKIVLPLALGGFVTLGAFSFGAGLRGDFLSVIWGLIFGGIPMGFNFLTASAMGYSPYLLAGWGLLVLLYGILFGKKHLARYGGKWRISVKAGYSGGSGRSSGGAGSSGGFGGGASGGGGASRSM